MRLICIFCLVLGYGFGLFQTAYIYSNSRNINIKEEGSGNAGTTNMFRVMGWKAGLITFLGDIAKLVAAVLFTHWVFISFLHLPISTMVLTLYTGLGVILGHNFPFYLRLNGGKGVAVSCALIVCLLDWRLIVFGIIAFAVVSLATKYISLASMITLLAFAIKFIIFTLTGNMNIAERWVPDAIILVILIAALCIFQHRENIKRLLEGKEHKFSFKQVKENADEADVVVQAQVQQNKEERREYKDVKREAKAEYRESVREAKEEYREIKKYKPTKYRKMQIQKLQRQTRNNNDKGVTDE